MQELSHDFSSQSEQPQPDYFLIDPITHLVIGATYFAYISQANLQQIDMDFPHDLQRRLNNMFQNLPTNIIAIGQEDNNNLTSSLNDSFNSNLELSLPTASIDLETTTIFNDRW